VAAAAHLALVAGEITLPHVTAHARLATRELTRGRYRRPFGIGMLLIAVAVAAPWIGTVATPLALAGLLAYEHAYVQAGQSVRVDGHNSHTNVCSSGGRTGFQFWMGIDRPSPDYAHAKVIYLISAHLESGHYFNPHAQRITQARQNGAKVIVLDTRLSKSATHADYWLSPQPGSEAAINLAVANHLIQSRRYDRDFVRRWWNWAEYLTRCHPDVPVTFEAFEEILAGLYAEFRPRPGGWSSGPPRWPRGAGRNTPCPATSAATCTPRGWRQTRWCCCPRSGCRPRSTPARRTPNGWTNSRTPTRSGSTRPTRPGSTSAARVTWCGWKPRSATSSLRPGSPRGSGRG